MTTRNFRVNNGLSVGDITISASANTITGLATAAPSADGDVSNKKYVDDSITAVASDTLTLTNKTFDANGTGNSITNLEVADFAGSAIVNVSETLASNDSDTALVTAGAIIDYVDAEDANIASDTLTFTNKTFDANGTGNSISNIETADFASAAFKDEDDLSGDSATAVASQQSIKAYVDNGLSSLSSTTLTAGNTTAVVSDSGSDGAFTVTADGNTELVVNDTSATFSGNVVVSGNLTVNGTTTTVATTNTTVSDSLIEYGNGTTGSPSNDAGIVIERGDSNNAFIGFDESEDKFRVGTGTFTGASTGNLTIATGTLVANIEGNVTGDVTGNADTATTLETARNIGGVSFNGSANINLPGVNTAGNQDTSGTAAIATTVTVADESSDTTCFPLFATAATGDLGAKSGSNLTFNSSTGVLAATTFSGSGASLTSLDGSNISSGTIAAARVATLNQNTSGTAGGLSSAVTVSLTGAVTGSATFTSAGDTASITTTIAANSVALGTDTTGNYVGTITGGTGINSSGATSGEGVAHTLSIDST